VEEGEVWVRVGKLQWKDQFLSLVIIQQCCWTPAV
jgi:hypothetical protein